MSTDAPIVRHVAFGRQRVSRHIEPRVRLDAGGTRLRLRALHVMGHGCAWLARTIGASDQTLQKITRGDAATISPRLRDAVTAVLPRCRVTRQASSAMTALRLRHIMHADSNDPSSL